MEGDLKTLETQVKEASTLEDPSHKEGLETRKLSNSRISWLERREQRMGRLVRQHFGMECD